MQPNDYFGDFDDLFERMTGDRWGVLGRYNRPGYRSDAGEADFAVDIAHHDDELVVTADVPGFEKEDIDVSVDGDLLTIRADAESGSESSGDGDTYVRRERHHHAMRRTIRLPSEVDGEGASASYRNGVLTVTIPVDAAADVRHIDVE